MAKVTINQKDFELKYTIESWKKLKSKGITPYNFQEKLNEDFASTVSDIVYFGLLPVDRSTIKINELDEQLGFDVMSIVNEAMMESMPNQKDQEVKKN